MTDQEKTEIKTELIAATRHYVKLAREVFGIRMRYPKVRFFEHSGTAGWAFCHDNRIEYNIILAFDNKEVFLYGPDSTVGHEVAHLVVYLRFGDKPRSHGVEWKNVMRKMGLNESRCHDYAIGKVKYKKPPRPKHKVYCKCKTHIIGDIKYKRLVAYPYLYYCRDCYTRLKVKKKE